MRPNFERARSTFKYHLNAGKEALTTPQGRKKAVEYAAFSLVVASPRAAELVVARRNYRQKLANKKEQLDKKTAAAFALTEAKPTVRIKNIEIRTRPIVEAATGRRADGSRMVLEDRVLSGVEVIRPQYAQEARELRTKFEDTLLKARRTNK